MLAERIWPLQHKSEHQRFQGYENEGQRKQPATPDIDFTRFVADIAAGHTLTRNYYCSCGGAAISLPGH